MTTLILFFIIIVSLIAVVLGYALLGRMTLCITFDDGLLSHARIAAPYLEKYGWVGTFNVPTDLLFGKSLTRQQYADMGILGKERQVMSWDDARSLLSRGHEVYPHTCGHKDLVDLVNNGDLESAEYEIRESIMAYLKELGAKPAFFCLPHNKSSAKVINMLRSFDVEPLSCSRLNFGDPGHMGYYGSIKEYLLSERRFGRVHVDIMVHGITPETGGWRPFKNMVAFIRFLEEIKQLEDAGLIRVVSYVSSHRSRDSSWFLKANDCLHRKIRRAVYKSLFR